jgi:hypothetical protein
MMDIITLDFETYYDKVYSLSKMTTEAYINNPLFEIIGVGVKINDGPADWYSGHRPSDFLRSLDFSKCAVLCHNAAFDGAILSWKLNIKPRLWLDTLSMARPLHSTTVGGSLSALATYYNIGTKGTEVIDAKGKRRDDFTEEELKAYGKYCTNDVDLTYKLFHLLKPSFRSTELMVIDQTIRMYTEPSVCLDRESLFAHLAYIKERKAALLAGSSTSQEHLMSNQKFAEALSALGVNPPTKISKTTNKETWAFSKVDLEFTELQNHPDHRVQALVSARLGIKSTLEETRTQAFIDIASRNETRLPIMLNYYAAHTGRFSGGDGSNLQNLPSRGNNTIRRAIRAKPLHKIIACDSSQIEARMVAWLAGQDDLLQAFREKRDVYSEFASEIYGRTITKKDTVERFVGKTCVLGLGYGMGAEKFKRTLEIGQAGVSVKIDLNEAERIVRLYRQKNWKIVQLWNACGHALTSMSQGGSGVLANRLPFSIEGITLPSKFRIVYPALRSSSNGFEYILDGKSYRKYIRDRMTGEPTDSIPISWTKIYGGKVTENLVQALAAIVIREQMAAIGRYYKVAFQVHDEIVLTVPLSFADAAEQKLVEIMSTPPKWAPDLPVACESGQADNYGDT